MHNFDPYNVLLSIATNIPQRLKTGCVLQGHKHIFYDLIRFIHKLVIRFDYQFDVIQFNIDYFGYISGTVHAKFSQGKKISTNAVKYT